MTDRRQLARILASLLVVVAVGVLVWRLVEHDAATVQPFDARLPHWKSAPVFVRIDPRLDNFADVARQAIRDWNVDAGCKVLAEAGPEDVPQASISWADGDACGAPALDVPDHVEASTYVCPGLVEVRASRLSDLASGYVTIRHELGHVLGLGHSEAGIMAPRPGPMRMPVIASTGIRRALHERLCR